jgi:thiamine pyrophosphokinase
MTFLIIANGPHDPQNAKKTFSATLIALDGAANHLNEHPPHFIIGDLDSLDLNVRKKFESLNVPILQLPDQERTDLEKALLFAKSKEAKEIFIISALFGERLDHHLANLNLLKKYYDKDCPLIFLHQNQVLRFLKDENFKFSGEKGSFCGFFGFPKGIVTTEGLKWDVSSFEVEAGKQFSSSNEILTSPIKIKVEGEILLVYSPSS